MVYSCTCFMTAHPILIPKMEAAFFPFMDERTRFQLDLETTKVDLLNKKDSGYIWFNHDGKMYANIIVDKKNGTIVVKDLVNRHDHFSFKTKLNYFIEMVEMVAKELGYVVVVDGLTEVDDLGHLVVMKNYTVTKKGRVEWSHEQVKRLYELYDKYKTIKWEIEKFKCQHMSDVCCIKAMDDRPISNIMDNPLFEESHGSPQHDNPLFNDFD